MRRFRDALLTLCLAVLCGSAARAQLQFDITPPAQTANPGQTIDWTIALKNLGSVEIFLNGFNVTLVGPGLSADESPFFVNAPLSLVGGASWSGVAFTTSSLPSTPAGTYSGNAIVTGGTDPNGTDNIGSQDFRLTVAPEGSSLALMLGGMAPIAGAFALRRRKK